MRIEDIDEPVKNHRKIAAELSVVSAELSVDEASADSALFRRRFSVRESSALNRPTPPRAASRLSPDLRILFDSIGVRFLLLTRRGEMPAPMDPEPPDAGDQIGEARRILGGSAFFFRTHRIFLFFFPAP